MLDGYIQLFKDVKGKKNISAIFFPNFLHKLKLKTKYGVNSKEKL